MPSYPSSFTNGSSAGQISVNNLSSGANATYQELNDIVNGNGETLSYNSAAKYPTDSNIGTEIIGVLGVSNRTDTYTDFNTIFKTRLDALQSAWDTAVGSITATEKSVAANGFGNNFNNLQSKLEKIARKVNELNADITKANDGSFVSTTIGRYPSGWNRYTNSAGGI